MKKQTKTDTKTSKKNKKFFDLAPLFRASCVAVVTNNCTAVMQDIGL